MTSISNLKVYTTHPHPCSYLPGKEATTLFIDPQAIITREIYSRLSDSGFRRSGEHLYAPHCENCHACIPVRIPVEAFKPSRTHRRVWARNADIIASEADSISDDPHFNLYREYINNRHADGDMYPASRDQYESFLTREWGLTRYYSFSSKSQLKAAAVIDFMDNGLSAVYTFFDHSDSKRSLGSYCIMWQIQLAQTFQLPYVYLGYWIKNCNKMNYKSNFRPLEYFIAGRWIRLTPES